MLKPYNTGSIFDKLGFFLSHGILEMKGNFKLYDKVAITFNNKFC